jgi:hypothetical protein
MTFHHIAAILFDIAAKVVIVAGITALLIAIKGRK